MLLSPFPHITIIDTPIDAMHDKNINGYAIVAIAGVINSAKMG
jgi:hypothetical protein